MILSDRQLRFIAKSALLINSFGWGLSILGLVLPSESAFNWLAYMGCQVRYDPKLDYWLRMTAFVFCWVGFLSLKAFVQFERSTEMVFYLGVLNTIGGLILVITGFQLNIPFNEFIPDSLFCLSTGSVMLYSSRCMSKNAATSDKNVA